MISQFFYYLNNLIGYGYETLCRQALHRIYQPVIYTRIIKQFMAVFLSVQKKIPDRHGLRIYSLFDLYDLT